MPPLIVGMRDTNLLKIESCLQMNVNILQELILYTAKVGIGNVESVVCTGINGNDRKINTRDSAAQFLLLIDKRQVEGGGAEVASMSSS